jgi:hypothetical protein
VGSHDGDERRAGKKEGWYGGRTFTEAETGDGGRQPSFAHRNRALALGVRVNTLSIAFDLGAEAGRWW